MTLAIAYPYAGFARGRDYEPATSDSQYLRSASNRRWNYLNNTALDWAPSIDATLCNIRGECGRENWDGEGALPITDLTIAHAERVARTLFSALSKGIPVPDIVPEPDGEIALSWTVDSHQLFSLSVGAHEKINFAGQFGNQGSFHGWNKVDFGDDKRLEESLEEVVRQILRLYPEFAGKSSVRRIT